MSHPSPYIPSRQFLGFDHAFRGLGHLLRTQLNARIHLVVTLMVVGAGLGFHIHWGEWIALSLAMGLVWCAECLNTALEFLADSVTQDHHEGIRRAKDVAAAGVFLASLAALIVGLLVFIPHLSSMV